jgi:hypothetical protein
MSAIRQQWMQQFPDLKPIEQEQSASGPYVAPGDMPLEMEVAYRCETQSAQIARNQFGDLQLLFKLRVLADDTSAEAGSHTEFVTLPFQHSDIHAGDAETVRKRHVRRVQDITRILSSADPQKYALYNKKQGDAFLDFAGQTMSKQDFEARKSIIENNTLDAIDGFHALQVGDFIESMAGVQFYIRKMPNTHKPRYPYTNIYAKRPTAAAGKPPIVVFGQGAGASGNAMRELGYEDAPF